jgi:hypothetical protein
LPHSKLTKHITRPVGSLEQVPVTYTLIAAFNGNLASPAFEDVPIHEIGGDIECFRQTDQGLCNLLRWDFRKPIPAPDSVAEYSTSKDAPSPR